MSTNVLSFVMFVLVTQFHVFIVLSSYCGLKPIKRSVFNVKVLVDAINHSVWLWNLDEGLLQALVVKLN